MWRTFVQIFKHFDGNFVLFLHQFLEKLVWNCGKSKKVSIIIDTFLITKLDIHGYIKQINDAISRPEMFIVITRCVTPAIK